MSVDIKSMTRKELEKLQDQIAKQLEKLAEQERKSALEAAEKAAQQHGYSLSQLTGGAKGQAKVRGRKQKGSGSINPPKYRNPDDPAQTWTGKGRRPEWIKDAQKKGIDIETMAI